MNFRKAMSSSNPSPPAPRGSLSLYANLLNTSSSSTSPSNSSTIARAPVHFGQAGGTAQEGQHDEASTRKHLNAAALRFQPTKRPQLQTQKPKIKNASSTTISSTAASSSPDHANKPVTASHATPVKSTLADWTVDDDDINGFYAGEKRQRGGRKKRKKNNAKEEIVAQDWDDIYDPSRPNNYEDYKHSEEKYREIREWKDRLYAHRLANRRDSIGSSEQDESDRAKAKSQSEHRPNFSFAPPADLNSTSPPKVIPSPPPPPPPAAEIPDDATGDDAYARRLRMSQQLQHPPPPPSPPPPPPPSDGPPQPSSTISRAPIRYNLPSAPAEIPSSEAALAAALSEDSAADDAANAPPDDRPAEPRSSRPGQAGFAARLMSKYGWSAGSGLGAAGNEGIVQPLRVQVEKRKKKSDAEGGGWVGPAGGKGRIIDAGRRRQQQQQQQDCDGDGAGGGQFGRMSEVVVLTGMLGGVDVAAELQRGELVQEIGDECGDKYGRVERVFVHQRATAAEARVFVKFTSQLSALRAVNALDGRIFNGNTIKARFYDAEKFESDEFGDDEGD